MTKISPAIYPPAHFSFRLLAAEIVFVLCRTLGTVNKLVAACAGVIKDGTMAGHGR